MSQALTAAPLAKSAAPLRHGSRLSPGVPSGPQRVRTPLSVVPARQVRRRAPFAVFSLLVLAAALATVLMINISVSSTQYDLVQLRSQQTALSQENEALVLEIEGREAPQNLAAAATKLKMVSFPTFGTIDLDAKKVTGDPEPAKEGAKPEVLIAAPNLTPKQPAPLAAPENVAEKPTPVSAGGADATGRTATDDGDAAVVEAAEAAAVADAAGTIPGPVQSSGNP
jgi:hypothetical protein